jgi:glutaminase
MYFTPKPPSKQMPAPTASLSPIQVIINELHRRLRHNHDGTVATYIPELGKADPNWFGICLVTADGTIYEAGDTAQTFTIQSISKAFNYGIALEDKGQSEVLKKIWMEPSGEAFNSISLQPGSGRPLNPMINAGAIATTGLVNGTTTDEKIRRITDILSLYAGRPLEIDHAVYRSESETGHRNRAIGHMLRNFDILTEDPTPTLEAYFMQCSLLVHCRDLAVMAATLANGGLNPLTGRRAVAGEYVENILSVMASCGMYDAAGAWIYQVGIPAKSGVAGGIMAVLPGQLGIGVFSPRLDPQGNSVRGIAACRELSQKFNLHLFNAAHQARSVIRRISSSAESGSKRIRSISEQSLLQKEGSRIRHLHIQGELHFVTAERIVRDTLAHAEQADHLLLNFRHASVLDFVAAELLSRLALTLSASGKTLTLTGGPILGQLKETFEATLPAEAWPLVEFIPDHELALETLENRLIAHRSPSGWDSRLLEPEECELFAGLEEEAKQRLHAVLKSHTFAPGERIIAAGSTDRVLFFILRGTADVWIEPVGRPRLRVASFSAGTALGELALIDASPRSATVLAHTKVECVALTAADFELLERDHPRLSVGILRNLAKVLARRLRKANSEISAAHAD